MQLACSFLTHLGAFKDLFSFHPFLVACAALWLAMDCEDCIEEKSANSQGVKDWMERESLAVQEKVSSISLDEVRLRFEEHLEELSSLQWFDGQINSFESIMNGDIRC